MTALLALLFSLIASAALAQNPTCPTRPAGDSSNACASTAFVQGAIPLGAITSLTGPVTATGPGAAATTIAAGVITNSNLVTAPAFTLKGNNTAVPATILDLTTAQAQALLGIPILVTDSAFGAVCDGVTNDTAAINTAIASAASGQTVYLPFGKACKVNTTVNIGNGTSSTASTVNGVNLGCLSNPVSSGLFTGLSLSSGCKLIWGGTTGNVISVNGPIQGWGLSGIAVDCLSQASSFGLNLQSALNGTIINTAWNNCARAHNAITVPQGGVFGNSNTENNNFYNTVVTMPNIASSGVVLTGQVTDTTSNSHANNYYGLNIYMPSTATAFNPIVLQDADSNRFYGVVIFGGGASCVAVQYNYSDHSIWPASNGFYGIDPGTNLCVTSFQNSGTPGASKSNYIYGLEEVNQAVAPVLANLAVYGSHNIVMAPGGNVASTDLMGAWSAFTPSFTCGTATFSVNNARSKTMGKTTWIMVDVAFTALGTCTTGVSPAFSFTLPNNALVATELTGREFNNNSAMVGCTLNTTSATVINCVKQTTTLINWVNGDRMIVSGTYENQ